MTDREMLELAARSVGIDLQFNDKGASGYYGSWRGLPQWIEWDPSEDDGDALRLAVDLNFLFKHAFQNATAEENDRCNGDYRAAVRRAIVRVAAGIGMTED